MHSKCNNILVTGASGFIGAFLLDSLLKDNSNKVTALYNKSRKELLSSISNSRLEWKQLDLLSSYNLEKLLVNIDVVYHLAGYSTVESTPEEIHLLNKINVDLTTKLVTACVNSCVKQFIFVSSIAACEDGKSILINESDGFPVSEYGKSKKRAEDKMIEILSHRTPYTILRPTALFGEYHEGSMLGLTRAINKKRFIMFGDGNNITTFYYIRDFVNVLLKVKLNKKAYNEIFICANNPVELNTLVSYIKKHIDSSLYVFHVPIFVGYIIAKILDLLSKITNIEYPLSVRRVNAMTRNILYSNNKLNTALSMDEEIGLEKGLENTISWYKKSSLL